MLKKSGLIFQSPMATASRMRNVIMAGQQRVHDIVLHIMQCHFLSVLIRIHVIHPNTTVSSVNIMNIVSNMIFHCNHCDANTALITIHDSTAAVSSGPSGSLNAKFMFKGTSPTNHFCTDS